MAGNRLRVVGAVVVIAILMIGVYYLGNGGAPYISTATPQAASSAATTAKATTANTTTTMATTIPTTTGANTNALPTVSILSPKNASTVNGVVNITAVATGPLKIELVRVYVGNMLYANLTAPPYTYFWNTTGLIGKQYIITVKAIDMANNTGKTNAFVNIGGVDVGK